LDDPHELIEHYRDHGAEPGYPYTDKVIELIRSRPEQFYNCSPKWVTPGIDPGYSHRYTVAADGATILDQVIPKNDWYARQGVGPGRSAPSAVPMTPSPPGAAWEE
jgi:hypothetical protein